MHLFKEILITVAIFKKKNNPPITSLTIKGRANWLLLAVAQVNVPVPRFSYPVVRKHYTPSAPWRAKQARQTRNVMEHEANSLSQRACLPQAGFFSDHMCQKSYENEKAQ